MLSSTNLEVHNIHCCPTVSDTCVQQCLSMMYSLVYIFRNVIITLYVAALKISINDLCKKLLPMLCVTHTQVYKHCSIHVPSWVNCSYVHKCLPLQHIVGVASSFQQEVISTLRCPFQDPELRIVVVLVSNKVVSIFDACHWFFFIWLDCLVWQVDIDHPTQLWIIVVVVSDHFVVVFDACCLRWLCSIGLESRLPHAFKMCFSNTDVFGVQTVGDCCRIANGKL